MSDMLDKMKEILEQTEQGEIEKPIDGVPPLEQAMNRAIFSLGEIILYADYNRPQEAAREAKEALEVITEIKKKYDEQNAIMEALTKPAESNDDDEI